MDFVDPRAAGMDASEVFGLFVQRMETIEVMQRTIAKAMRGGELRTWALNPVPVDPGSSLAADDRDFMTEYSTATVSTNARFPIMNAVDCLDAIEELIDWRPRSRNSHIGSIITLCRTATESAATTIWLLMSPERAMRRGLSVRFANSETKPQLRYHASTKKWFAADPARLESQQYQDFLEHVRLYEKRTAIFRKGERATPNGKVRGNDDVVRAAAEWIDKHPPPHATGDRGPYGNQGYGFADVASSFYTVSSAIVHGLKWPLDYMPNGELDMSRWIVEGVNVAVGMAECAVALFEAQAQQRLPKIKRERYYPRHLAPTIKTWSAEFPVHPRIDSSCLIFDGVADEECAP
nr:hypothetical protein [Mycolicibacterium komanii]CRL77982.1 hypothetical protein CPGR_04984 [Mycolicibacterium komanii]